jgi:hypothetical protein
MRFGNVWGGGDADIRFIPDKNVIIESGNVGIGTPGLTTKLQVAGDISFDQKGYKLLFGPGSTSSEYMYSDVANGDLHFFLGGAEKVTFKQGGNVGIGTNDPKEYLHLHNSGSVSYMLITNGWIGHTQTDGLRIGTTAYGNGLIWLYENAPLRFATNNQDRVRIDETGNVGIGDDLSPDAKLEIVKSASGDILNISSASGNDGDLVTILNNGYVGIGTTNPGAKLDIGGTAGTDGIMFPDGSLQTTALQKYDSGWFAVSANNVYSKAHLLGAVPSIVEVWVGDKNDGSGWVTTCGGPYHAGYCGTYVVAISNTNITVRVWGVVAAIVDAGGTAREPASGYARIKAIK